MNLVIERDLAQSLVCELKNNKFVLGQAQLSWAKVDDGPQLEGQHAHVLKSQLLQTKSILAGEIGQPSHETLVDYHRCRG